MNILEVEDIIKGLPDQALQKEAQAPSGQVPQFLVVSEIQRRTDMRKRFQSQQQEQPQGTISQQIVQEGIASIAPPPQQMMPQQPMAPQQPMPPQQMPMGQSLAQPMYRGGVVEMNTGRQATIGLPDDEEEEERYGLSISEAANNPMSIRQYNQDWEGEVGTYSSEGSGDFVKYDTPAHSIRAGDRLLRTFQRDAGVDTIRKAISKYAPPKGDDGYTNPTNKYIEYVSQQSGIDPDEPLDFEDPVTRSRLVSPMAFFESNTVLTPEQVRSTIASVDEEYANTLPQLPTVGEGATRAEFMRGMTGPARTKELIESVESGIPVSSVGRDASRKEFMAAMMAPETAIANAIKEDGDKTKESDVQDKEQIEAVEAFTSGSTSLPVVVAKEKKKVDLFAGARKADKLLNAYMPDPLGQFDAERAAALVDSIGEGATRKEFMAGMTEKPYMPDPLGQFDAERAAALVDSVGEGATRKEFMAGMTRPYMPDLLSQIEKEKKLYEKQYMPDPLGQFEAERAALEDATQAEIDPTSMSRKARRDRQKEIAQARPPEAPKGRGRSRSGRNVRNIPNVPRVDLEGVEAFEEGQEAIDAIAASSLRESQASGQKKPPPVIYDPLDKSRVFQQESTVDAPSATTTSSGDMYDLMREIAGTREEAKKEAFANAMIQLGAGVASGNLAAGLSAAGKAASETMSDYRDRALKGRMAELQLKRADIQEARYKRQEELSEQRLNQSAIGAANRAILSLQEGITQSSVYPGLKARLGKEPDDVQLAQEVLRQKQAIVEEVATNYGLDKRLLGGASALIDDADDLPVDQSEPPSTKPVQFEMTGTRPAQ